MRRRRGLAWALIAYGVAGIVLLVVTAVVGLGMAARLELLMADADETLAAASRSVDAAAASFTGIDSSLTEAEASAEDAAGLARRASGTLDALGAAMQLSIFGAQPLLPLAGEFSASADLASELAGRLDAVGSSLADTRDDVGDIGTELDVLGRELAQLGDSTASDSAPPLRVLGALLLLWLALPAVAALVSGGILLATSRRPAGLSVGGTEHSAQPEE